MSRAKEKHKAEMKLLATQEALAKAEKAKAEAQKGLADASVVLRLTAAVISGLVAVSVFGGSVVSAPVEVVVETNLEDIPSPEDTECLSSTPHIGVPFDSSKLDEVKHLAINLGKLLGSGDEVDSSSSKIRAEMKDPLEELHKLLTKLTKKE